MLPQAKAIVLSSAQQSASPRAMSAADIQEKFLANAQLKLSPAQAAETLKILMDARGQTVRAVVKALKATA